MTVSRRRFLSLGVGAFVVLTLPASLRRMIRQARRSVPLMGTIADLVVVDPDEAKAQEAIDAAIRELRWVERTMSHFTPDSDVGRANLGAASGPVAVTAATAAVLEEALRWAELSDGRFDPCLGKASALWSVGERQTPPSTSETRRFAGERLYRELEVDRWQGDPVVRFRSDAAAIDLGGIAKGYGVDRAVRALRERGVEHALVNAGGDLYAMGRSEDGDPWEIGVRDPLDPGRLAATLGASDRALATSGDYFRYFDHGGRRYHHLIDPATGEPTMSRHHSITVAANTCMAADAGGTAAFGCELDEARELIARAEPGAEIVHTA
ncbi:MAG: FAD:protein FMN transferase [Gemmatimonadales bacterium]|jgi:thiamine biosynthesis lipoprotein